MDTYWIGLLSFALGVCSGFIGALSSGGGLISIPGLIFLGLPPSTAIATTRLNVIFGGIAAVYKYNKEKIIDWKMAAQFIPIAVIGGIAGSTILLRIDEQLLETVVGILLLLLAPLLILGTHFGLADIKRTKNRQRLGYLALILVMTYSAFFGGGGGTFLIYALVFFYGMTIIKANANGILLSIIIALTSLIVFLPAGAINFTYGIPMMFGATIGSYLGARTALKRGNIFIRWVFLAIVIASSIKLIFF